MEKDKVTPEEKLLKIIENPETAKEKPPLDAKPKGVEIKNAGALFKGIKINKELFKQVNLRLINKAVIGLGILLTIFWFFDFITMGQKSGVEMAKVIASPDVFEEGAKKAAQPELSIGEVAAQARKRNIFSFLPPKAEAAAGETSPPLGEVIKSERMRKEALETS